jgi:AbrB family looped-hinge helix DNA binding protein
MRSNVAQLSSRGQITLPAEVRQALGLKAGDTLLIRLEEGRVVLEPALVLPLERYSQERIAEFAQAAEISPVELAQARKKWGLSLKK